MIKFSCILTVYSGTCQFFLDEAIFSILNQTLLPNELIIVIDGPIANNVLLYIENLIKKTKKINIKRLALQKNEGSGVARNAGIKIAKYDWIAIMDCDDLSLNTRFEKQAKIALKNPHIDFISSLSDEYYDLFAEKNYLATKQCPQNSSDIITRLNYSCCITNPTIFFKKSIWEKVGGYGHFQFLNEDHYFFLKLAKAECTFFCIQESLVKVRTSKEQRNRRFGLKLFIIDFKFRYHCLIENLINFKGFLMIIPIFFRRFIPNFLMTYFHKLWRSI